MTAPIPKRQRRATHLEQMRAWDGCFRWGADYFCDATRAFGYPSPAANSAARTSRPPGGRWVATTWPDGNPSSIKNGPGLSASLGRRHHEQRRRIVGSKSTLPPP